MKGRTHAGFRIAFEGAIEDYRDASMEVPNAEHLYRKYISKITQDLRDAVAGIGGGTRCAFPRGRGEQAPDAASRTGERLQSERGFWCGPRGE